MIKRTRIIIGLIVAAVAVSVFADHQWKDPDKWIRTSLSMKGVMNDTAMTDEQVAWVLSLPRRPQIDLDSAMIKPDVWTSISEEEDVVVLFAGGLIQGRKILDIRGK